MERRNGQQASHDDLQRIVDLLAQAMTPAERNRVGHMLSGMLRERRKRHLRLIQGGKIIAVIAFMGGASAWMIRVIREHMLTAAVAGGVASTAIVSAVWTTPLEGTTAPAPVPEVTAQLVDSPASSAPVPSTTPPPAEGSPGPVRPSVVARPPVVPKAKPPPAVAPKPAPPSSPPRPDPVPTVILPPPRPDPIPPPKVPVPKVPVPLPTVEVPKLPLPPLPDPVPTILDEVCELPLDPVCDLLDTDEEDAGDEEEDGGGVLGDVLGDLGSGLER